MKTHNLTICNKLSNILICAMFSLLISCQEKEEPLAQEEDTTSTIKDIDGNEYDIIEFAGNWWTVQNLRTSRYANGEIIPQVKDDKEWSELESGAFCWYDNNPNVDRPYGKMYNWYAASCCQICPKGWRLPNEKDIEELEKLRFLAPHFSGIYVKSNWADDFTFNAGIRYSDGSFWRTSESGSTWYSGTFRWVQNSAAQDIKIKPTGFLFNKTVFDEGIFFTITEVPLPDPKKGGYIRCIKII
jgi:uncharacterized protein (TIGR02145 family)